MENVTSLYTYLELIVGWVIVALFALLLYYGVWFLLVHFWLTPLMKIEPDEETKETETPSTRENKI